MKFRCDRDDFSEALQTVQRGVSNRPGIPALTGVLLEAGTDTLTLTTTDLEVTARLGLPVQIQEQGVALIPARLLADMVKSRRRPVAGPHLVRRLRGDRSAAACGGLPGVAGADGEHREARGRPVR